MEGEGARPRAAIASEILERRRQRRQRIMHEIATTERSQANMRECIEHIETSMAHFGRGQIYDDLWIPVHGIMEENEEDLQRLNRELAELGDVENLEVDGGGEEGSLAAMIREAEAEEQRAAQRREEQEIQRQERERQRQEQEQAAVQARRAAWQAERNLNDTPESRSICYARKCGICHVDNPRVRAVMTACGHSCCMPCAEEHSGGVPNGSLDCSLCRTRTKFVRLYEDVEEAVVRPDPSETGKLDDPTKSRKRPGDNEDQDGPSSSKRMNIVL